MPPAQTIAAMKTPEFHASIFTHVAFNNSDSHGSEGWWEEGNSPEECHAKAAAGAAECGFDDAPEMTVVKLSDLAELDEAEFDDLVSQWGLSWHHGWTTNHTAAAIHAEWIRRDEPAISGRAANRGLDKMSA